MIGKKVNISSIDSLLKIWKVPNYSIWQKMFCPYCGLQNLDIAKYCEGCGRRIDTFSKPISAAIEPQMQSQNLLSHHDSQPSTPSSPTATPIATGGYANGNRTCEKCGRPVDMASSLCYFCGYDQNQQRPQYTRGSYTIRMWKISIALFALGGLTSLGGGDMASMMGMLAAIIAILWIWTISIDKVRKGKAGSRIEIKATPISTRTSYIGGREIRETTWADRPWKVTDDPTQDLWILIFLTAFLTVMLFMDGPMGAIAGIFFIIAYLFIIIGATRFRKEFPERLLKNN